MLKIAKRSNRILFLFCSLWILGSLFPGFLSAQRMEDYLGDEKVLYAETKQVNQFFRRFNCEEGPDGKRYYRGDSLYHNAPLRREYLNMLFDQQNESLDNRLRQEFMQTVMSRTRPTYLNFHGGNWFAEVNTTFTYKGKEEKMTLFMELEDAEVGSKWVFTNVYFEPFRRLFQDQSAAEVVPAFIHPLSHELDFMNLIKVFNNGGKLEHYALKSYLPDYLTLFLYESKLKNLRFRSVDKVKFHFFQVEGWYFELQEFNRTGMNRGWLISQMTRIPAGQKDILLKYIYRR